MGEPPSKHVHENWAFQSRLVIVGERASCTGAASVYVMPQAALGRPQYYYDLHVRDRFGRDMQVYRCDGMAYHAWLVRPCVCARQQEVGS